MDGTSNTLAATATFAQGYTHAVGGFDSTTNSATIYLYTASTGASRLVRMGIPPSGTAGIITELNPNPGISGNWSHLVWLAAPDAYRVFFYSATTHNAATVDFLIPTSGDTHAAVQRSSVVIPAAYQGATALWRSAFKYQAGAVQAAVVNLYNGADGTTAYIYVNDTTGEIFPNSTPGTFGGTATFTRWPSTQGTPTLPGTGLIFPVPLSEAGHTFARGINASVFALNGQGGGILHDLQVQTTPVNVFNNSSFSGWSQVLTLDNGITVFYLNTNGVIITARLTRTAPFFTQVNSTTTDLGLDLVIPLVNERRTSQIP